MWEFTIIVLVLSGILMLILGAIALGRRASPLALSFAAVTVCAAIWDFGFAAEILIPSLEGKILWANVQFLGITFLPVAWLALTLYTTGQPRQATRSLPAGRFHGCGTCTQTIKRPRASILWISMLNTTSP